ncbi:RNA polymerase sigma-B factor [Actinoplanes lutulentus]|uniref:RNA polymerase sigma-37 (RpsB/SigB) subunit n=1 Tax=Actinoplanes lutulentus TaxID=1287878 RepID=A0A327ZJ53_9ACTN|nr:SigB/SigF/SigG family RNA polymerase sigma factor [Actinoplanes lutulentus]MBB2940696.1 RNA polymerase sigma-B factor [Actinoplanes lutulentus]RAK43007.1 RNA polymerase sigma-37 (RpsB/SigB) subunit [Actinoplanes lutulentus]
MLAHRDRTRDEPSALLAALVAMPAGDPSRRLLRDRTIEAWLPMARRLASRYSGRGVPVEDLIQTATIGLIKAVDRFDPTYGSSFVGYAVPTVLGELKRYFRDRAWMVRVPRKLQELRLAIAAANADLTFLLQRSPTVADIAGYLDITDESVLEGLEGTRAYTAVSMSTPLHHDGSGELADILGDDDHAYAAAEDRIALAPALAVLDDRERKILILRFYGNLTQADIAERVGISQMHVSRLISRALLKLRHRLQDNA